MNRLMLTGLFVVLLVAADAPKDEASKKDLQQLQGTWQLSYGEFDGKQYTDLEVTQSQIVFDGNRYTVPASDVGFKRSGTFKIDATSKPKNLEFVPAQDSDTGRTCHGIFELDGDTYKVCFAPPGKDQPREFAAKPGSGYTLHIWKREKK